VSWYHVPEYAALWDLLDQINAEMDAMACLRCNSFQADLESQQRQHKTDELCWREVLAEKNLLIAEQAVRIDSATRFIGEQAATIRELEAFAVSDATVKQQLEQRVQQLTEQKQHAARVQCNADYMRFVDVTPGSRE